MVVSAGNLVLVMRLPIWWRRARRWIHQDLLVLGFAGIEYYFLSAMPYPPGHATGDRIMLAILLSTPYVLLYVWRLIKWIVPARWVAWLLQGWRR